VSNSETYADGAVMTVTKPAL